MLAGLVELASDSKKDVDSVRSFRSSDLGSVIFPMFSLSPHTKRSAAVAGLYMNSFPGAESETHDKSDAVDPKGEWEEAGKSRTAFR